MLTDALLIAIGFNLLLLVIGYVSGYRAILIVSSIVWVLIGLSTYQETEDVLTMAIILMIAVGQVFLPMREERSSLLKR